jgi:hypothetical protein
MIRLLRQMRDTVEDIEDARTIERVKKAHGHPLQWPTSGASSCICTRQVRGSGEFRTVRPKQHAGSVVNRSRFEQFQLPSEGPFAALASLVCRHRRMFRNYPCGLSASGPSIRNRQYKTTEY